MKLIQTLASEETGASMVEYAVLLAIITVGVVSAVGLFRDQIVSVFNSSASGLANVTSGGGQVPAFRVSARA